MREAFRAAQVSLGALGVIVAVRMQLLPLYRLHEQCRREPLDALPGVLEERSRANRHFEFFWYPTDDFAFTKTLNPTDRAATRAPLGRRPARARGWPAPSATGSTTVGGFSHSARKPLQ